MNHDLPLKELDFTLVNFFFYLVIKVVKRGRDDHHKGTIKTGVRFCQAELMRLVFGLGIS